MLKEYHVRRSPTRRGSFALGAVPGGVKVSQCWRSQGVKVSKCRREVPKCRWEVSQCLDLLLKKMLSQRWLSRLQRGAIVVQRRHASFFFDHPRFAVPTFAVEAATWCNRRPVAPRIVSIFSAVYVGGCRCDMVESSYSGAAHLFDILGGFRPRDAGATWWNLS